MPSFSIPSFAVDLPTLCAVTVFISVTGGLLLLFSWLQNRSEQALAFWGVGYLVGSAGSGLLALAGWIPNAWSIGAGIALICCAYGVMWAGARSFEGRHVHNTLVFAGAALWLAAYQLHTFGAVPACIMVSAIILAAYTLGGAWEVWHARDRELMSRWPTLALLIVHAGFLLSRIPAVTAMQFPPLGPQPHKAAIFVVAFEALFCTFCLAFLRVSMAKERAELAQKRAALTDSLTGVANRRAFFDQGEPLLELTIADRRPVALLLFDLDRFKEVNDTGGHQAGDRVLKKFSDLVAAAMLPGDLFARLGGEEFACLLADAPMTRALLLAERVRRDFAAMAFPGIETHATVSVGVAMASEAGRGLSSLLATADRALYRAKAEGRNRVAPAPLVLVNGGEAARPAADAGRSAAFATPLLG